MGRLARRGDHRPIRTPLSWLTAMSFDGFDADTELKAKPPKRTRKPKAKKPEPPTVVPDEVEPEPVEPQVEDMREPPPRKHPVPWNPRTGLYPVRVRKNENRERGHDWAKSDRWMPLFLDFYRLHGNATKAADEAGVNRMTVASRRASDAEFKSKYDEAREDSIERRADTLEEAFIHQSTVGQPDVRMNKDGELVTVGRRINSIPGMMVLKGLRPIYRDNYQGDQNGAGQIAATAIVNFLGAFDHKPSLDATSVSLMVTDPAARRAQLQAEIARLNMELEACPLEPAGAIEFDPDSSPPDADDRAD